MSVGEPLTAGQRWGRGEKPSIGSIVDDLLMNHAGVKHEGLKFQMLRDDFYFQARKEMEKQALVFDIHAYNLTCDIQAECSLIQAMVSAGRHVRMSSEMEPRLKRRIRPGPLLRVSGPQWRVNRRVTQVLRRLCYDVRFLERLAAFDPTEVVNIELT